MTAPIASPRNPRVVEAAKLRRSRERRRRGETLVEGPHLLAEAAAHRAPILRVFGLEDDGESARLAAEAGADWIPVEDPVLERLAPTETPRGPVAVLAIPAPGEPGRDLLWLAVSDPGNAGSCIRTAAAFGFDVVATAEAADPWAPKVIRAAAGGHFRVSIGRGGIPREWGALATVPRGGVPLDRLDDVLDPDRWWALLIGSEAHGLDPITADAADVAVTIPMPGGMESLNAGVAAGIVAQRVSEWRERVGPVANLPRPRPETRA